MVRFDFFDESYYLASYPDVRASVTAPRGFFSGLEHFERFGRFEGRSVASPYYDEASYLAKYPDVAAAVTSGAFRSGLQHFTEFGYDEGRSPNVGILGAGDVYLRKYPDVAAAVAGGVYRSWYDHYINAGRFEGRSPSYFNEQDYLALNPDVAAAVANSNDTIVSGFDHYIRFGQFENRQVLFSGTAGSDVITSFGGSLDIVDVTGVDYRTLSPSPFDYALRSTGVGEIDTIIASSTGGDNIILGTSRSPSNPNPVSFYVGGGAADYAVIKNFVRGLDRIQLAGSLSDYSQEVSGGNLSILTRTGRDLVAVVEGITTPLGQISVNATGGTSTISL